MGHKLAEHHDMITTENLKILNKVKSTQKLVRSLTSKAKEKFILDLAIELERNKLVLLQENGRDVENLKKNATEAFRDRLTLNESRVMQMAESLRQVATLPDPVGVVTEQKTLENGLLVEKVLAPLGVILMIFESRPNVIFEAFSLAFRSGNSILLKGGKESRYSANCMYRMILEVARKNFIPPEIFWGIEDYDRDFMKSLLERKDLIDVVVPRGGEGLIEFVQTHARMPIIKNDRGLCHAFVDESADINMAINVLVNAKTQRPGVCNSIETILVHEKIAKAFLPSFYKATDFCKLKWFVDYPSRDILKKLDRVELAEDHHWNTEHLDLILNCRLVKNLEEALQHIEIHGSKHSELILTQNKENAEKFLREVDAAATYWNASTRFTDGFQLGLGGELGISTQKLHVRGPVGLKELTTARWIMRGQGQIRS